MWQERGGSWKIRGIRGLRKVGGGLGRDSEERIKGQRGRELED